MHWYNACSMGNFLVFLMFVKNMNEYIPLFNIAEQFGILLSVIYLLYWYLLLINISQYS